jgi:hypothetical protein
MTESEMAFQYCWRTIGANTVTRCQTANCAAWRWAGWRVGKGDKVQKTQGEQPDSNRVGYCGPCGRPHE